MSSGFKTGEVLVSHSKSPSLIFDQKILKLFKTVRRYAICIKLSGSYESLPKTICDWHIFEWELIGVILKYVKNESANTYK